MSEVAASAKTPASRTRWAGLLPESQLAKRATTGDDRAFAAIFRRYHQELYRYCKAILTDPDDAEDAMQTTMVKALAALPGERRQIALRPWLYRVAHNESISLLRERRRRVDLEAAKLAAPLSLEATSAQRERVRSLISDLAALPERQRASLVMRELSGLSYEEIAASLELTAAGARQAVYEARTALQDVAEGREMECRTAREAMSAGDRRVLRGRRLRAHLGGCSRCSDFEAAIGERRRTLAVLAPPLAAPVALAILQSVVTGGSTSSAGAAAAGASTGGVMGAGFAGGAAVKATTTVLVVAAVGGGAATIEGLYSNRGDRESAQERVAPAGTPPRSESGSDASGVARPSTILAGGGGGLSGGGEVRQGGRDPERVPPDSQPAGPGNSSQAPSQSGEAPGQTVSTGAPAMLPGQSGAPPGQSGEPPGQSGAPPGQSGQPPGQTQSNAGGGGTASAPGQTGASPGRSESAPGHSPSGVGASSNGNGNAIGHLTAPGQAEK